RAITPTRRRRVDLEPRADDARTHRGRLLGLARLPLLRRHAREDRDRVLPGRAVGRRARHQLWRAVTSDGGEGDDKPDRGETQQSVLHGFRPPVESGGASRDALERAGSSATQSLTNQCPSWSVKWNT